MLIVGRLDLHSLWSHKQVGFSSDSGLLEFIQSFERLSTLWINLKHVLEGLGCLFKLLKLLKYAT